MSKGSSSKPKEVAVLERPLKTKVAAAKDKEELQLEKLVFGDDEGFQQALRTYETDDFGTGDFTSEDEDDEDDREIAENKEDLDEVADDDLFFVDTGVPAAEAGALVLATEPEDDDENVPAWIDSDDEKMVVSLASDTRLRKLRRTEAEDLVNGKEYIRRLQEQFERLYPRPHWAVKAEAGHRKKRRRTSEAGDSDDENDSDDSIDLDELESKPLSKLLQSTESFTEAPSSDPNKRNLRAGVLDIQRSKDIGEPQPSAISSLSFHPTKPLLLSSGPSGLLNLHHLSPASQPANPTLHTLSVPRHPIYTSSVDASGSSIYFASRRRYFLNWSLTTGKVTRSTRLLAPVQKSATTSKMTDQRSCERFKLSPCGRWIALIGSSKKTGIVNILSASTSQWHCQARVEGKNGVADLAWWSSGEGMVIISKGGDIVEYSIEARRAIALYRDDGIVAPTTIALGGKLRRDNGLGTHRWLAIGSQSGIVTIYDRSEWSYTSSDTSGTKPHPNSTSAETTTIPTRLNPHKTLTNLTTAISHLTFSDDGQMLVLASRWKKDALRLVHVGSWTVYPRWPTSGTPLGRVTAVALSPGAGRLLVVGNEAGKIRSWEVRG